METLSKCPVTGRLMVTTPGPEIQKPYTLAQLKALLAVSQAEVVKFQALIDSAVKLDVIEGFGGIAL